MTYQGLATLLVRLAGVALLVMQIVGAVGTTIVLRAAPTVPPMGGGLYIGTAIYVVVAVLLIALSRTIARLLADGL